jgi:HSP20 family molecular chaperone IbpA
VISGNIVGPESGHSRTGKQENVTGTIDTQGDGKDPQPHEPELLVRERRLGPFRRHLTFPEEVDMEKLTAKLEAGLLHIRVPKKGLSATKTSMVNVQ